MIPERSRWVVSRGTRVLVADTRYVLAKCERDLGDARACSCLQVTEVASNGCHPRLRPRILSPERWRQLLELTSGSVTAVDWVSDNDSYTYFRQNLQT